MNLYLRKWILICLIVVIVFPVSFSIIHFLITKNPNYLLAHLTEIARQEDYDIIEKLNLPEFQLKFNEDDIAHFEDLYKDYRQFQDSGEEWFEKDFLPYYQKNNKWRKLTMLHNKVEYKVKIKSHGRSPVNHKYGKYFSIKIKLLDNKTIYNISEFRLIIYRRVVADYDLLYNLIKGTNMIYQKDKLVLLRINEWEPKLYYFEQNVNQEFFANQGFENKIILEHPKYGSLIHTGGDTSLIKIAMSEFFQNYDTKHKFLKNYQNFNNAIINRSPNMIINFLDIEYITTFNALRLFMRGNAHGLIESNLKICLDTTNQLFYPIFHRDFTWNRVSDKPHKMANSWDIGVNSDLFFSIDANDSLRRLTYKKMYEYIIGKRECKLKSNIDSILNFHESLYYSSYIKSILGMGTKEFISSSFSFFKELFEKVNLNINYYKGKDTFMMEIEPNSISFLGIEKLCIQNIEHESMDSIKLKLIWFVEGNIINEALFRPDEQNKSSISFAKSLKNIYFFNKLDNKSEWKKSKYQLILKVNSSNVNYTIHYLFKNRTTGSPIPEEKIKVSLKN